MAAFHIWSAQGTICTRRRVKFSSRYLHTLSCDALTGARSSSKISTEPRDCPLLLSLSKLLNAWTPHGRTLQPNERTQDNCVPTPQIFAWQDQATVQIWSRLNISTQSCFSHIGKITQYQVSSGFILALVEEMKPDLAQDLSNVKLT